MERSVSHIYQNNGRRMGLQQRLTVETSVELLESERDSGTNQYYGFLLQNRTSRERTR
jgi:hypothetical protein